MSSSPEQTFDIWARISCAGPDSGIFDHQSSCEMNDRSYVYPLLTTSDPSAATSSWYHNWHMPAARDVQRPQFATCGNTGVVKRQQLETPTHPNLLQTQQTNQLIDSTDMELAFRSATSPQRPLMPINTLHDFSAWVGYSSGFADPSAGVSSRNISVIPNLEFTRQFTELAHPIMGLNYSPREFWNQDFSAINIGSVDHQRYPTFLLSPRSAAASISFTDTNTTEPSPESVGRLSTIPAAWKSHRSTRPPASWIPDCQVSIQETFKPAGLLWASTYECKWIGCGQTIDRKTFTSCEAYLRSVYAHFSEHARSMPKGKKDNGCGWKGCGLKTRSQQGFKHTRDKMRHIVTHLPWYTLCTNCARISARRDVGGGNRPCASGKCWPSANLAVHVQRANEERRQAGSNITVARFRDIVFGGVS